MKNSVENNRKSTGRNTLLLRALKEENQLLKAQLEEQFELVSKSETLQSENKALIAKFEALETKLQEMLPHYDWLNRQVFGNKSERYTPEPDLHVNDLFNQGKEGESGETDKKEEPEEKVIAEHTRKIKKKKSSKMKMGESVPVFINLIDIPEEERTCPVTGELFRQIGEDRKEQLYITPARAINLVTVRPKYANTIDTPEGPKTEVMQSDPAPVLLRGSKFHVSALIYLIVQKFVFHVPLNRIIEDLRNKDVTVSSQALSGALIRVAAKLKPLFELMEKELFSQKHLFTDDTGAKMLQNKAGPAKKTHVWVYIGGDPDKPPYMIYKHSLGHGHDVPREHLSEFSGQITADAFGGYVRLDRDPDVDILWNACWDHGRRKFEPYAKTSKVSGFMMEKIRDLSMNERECWATDAQERMRIRTEIQTPLVDEIFKELKRVNDLGELTPKNKVQVGINYFLDNETNFRRFLTDPKLRIENNTSEHGARKVVIGRNNWMFFGSKRGADAGCMFMSFAQTCRKMEIDLTDYLTDIFGKLAVIDVNDTEKMRELLPHVWKENNTCQNIDIPQLQRCI